jgi:hypothetical protein
MNAVIPRTNTAAIISLVFGILCWFVLPFVGAIVAVVTGHMARGEIRRAPPGTLDGDGLALTGLILGWAHIALWIIGLFFIFVFFGGVAFFTHWFH